MSGPISARHFLTEKMEHKQFTSDNMNHSPHSNQGFQADRFLKKTNQLNIPDTIVEQCSAELSGESLKMEVPKIINESLNNDDKENVNNQKVPSTESLNDSVKIMIDNSYIRQCERKLFNSSSSDEDRSNESLNKSLLNNDQLLKISRKFNETISTPPSLLRKEISMLRTEMAEADEFHDLEIQLLKEEKCLNEVDSENYVELFKKYSELTEMYTVLKTEYDEYRKVQEKVTRELQSKTADCLESLCSQIEASDNSLNFSSASFISFNGGIRSSTMMEDISEVEATVMQDVTVLASDPLSITSDVFKTPVQTPLKTPLATLSLQDLNSTLKKPLVKDVKETIAKLENTVPLDSEFEIQLLNLEAALADKVKEVEGLEQRLFKIEDLSSVLQNEFERVGSVYTKENNSLKESLSTKTEQLNELTERLFTETISLNPSLRDSLIDVSGQKLLNVFIETIMESCKKIKGDNALNLQNQVIELDVLKKKCENLENELLKAEGTILTRDEEIRLLQSHVSNVRQAREDLAAAKLTLSEIESRLTLEEAEKKAAEGRCIELEAAIEVLKRELDIKEKFRTDLEIQLSSAEQKTSEIETENARLKEMCDSLNTQIFETEKILKSNESELISLKERITFADETIQQVKSQLTTTEEEKSELEKRCQELQETNQNLLVEITTAKNLENNPEFESVRTENIDLKQKILECEKAIAELAAELNCAKESQESNSHKVVELVKEIEELNKEKFSFSKTLENVEENQRNLANVLSDFAYDVDLPSDKIANLIGNKFQEPSETRETKIMSVFVETITKTCKGIQNELIKQFDSKRHEWEIQKHVDVQNLQEQINVLAQQNESALKQIKEELAAAEVSISKLQSQLSKTEIEKVEIETQCKMLEENAQTLQAEIDNKETIVKELREMNIVREEIEKENGDLKQQLLDSEEEIIRLKKSLEIVNEEQISKEKSIKESQTEIELLKKEKEDLTGLAEKLEKFEKNNRNLEDVILEVQIRLGMPDDTLNKIISGDIENNKIFSERITEFMNTQIEGLNVENQQLKLGNDNLKEKIKQLTELTEATANSSLAEDLLQSHVSSVTQMREELAAVKLTLSELESKLKVEEAEKKLAENRCIELEVAIEDLKRELDIKEKLRTKLEFQLSSTEKKTSEMETEIAELKTQLSFAEQKTSEIETENDGLKTQLSFAEQKTSEVETENGRLKDLCISVNAQMIETENILKSKESELLTLEERLISANETIEQVNSQLKIKEQEKSELENRCKELEENNQNLLMELSVTKNLENNPEFESVKTENIDLKQKILECEKIITELRTELNLAKESQENNSYKIEELLKEINQLNEEKLSFSETLESIEENQKILADILSDVVFDADMPSDSITKLITNKFQEPSDKRESKILSTFVETLSKTCKNVQNELIKQFDIRKFEWETQKGLDIEILQEQINLLIQQKVEYEADLKQMKEKFAAADESISNLKSQLSTVHIEKDEMETQCRKLEESIQTLQIEIEIKQGTIKDLNFVRQELETENARLKELCDSLNAQIIEAEKIPKSSESELMTLKEQLTSADETIAQVKSQLKLKGEEKSELENMMAELKAELEVAKENQMNNICKVEELIREIEDLKKENNGFSCAFTTIEETQKNLADILSCPPNVSELPTDRITKIMEKTSRLPDTSETREKKIVSDFVETITKTCKGVQNELIKQFDSKKLEWETQKDVDIQNLQEQINLLTQQNVQYEEALKEIKEELAAADEAISQLKSQLSTAQVEKVEVEVRCQKLEENTQTLQAEIDNKQMMVKELNDMKIVRHEIETENGDLKHRVLESEEVIIRLKKSLEIVKEEQIAKETRIKESQTEIALLKKEKEGLIGLTEKLEMVEKNNKNLMDVISEVQTRLDMPEDTLSKILSGNLETHKIFSEKIEHLINSQLEGLNIENKHLKLGNDNLKEKVKQLTKLIGETSTCEPKEEIPNLNISHSTSMSLRSKSGRKSDLCVRRLDKLEEINHNLTELITRILTMTEFPEPEKLKLYSVREFPKVMKKVIAHLDSKLKELKEENAQLDEECETYANIIKDLKKEAAAVWKTNKEKTEAMEEEIGRLKEEKNCLENEKKDLMTKIAKLDADCQNLKSSKHEGASHTCTCDSKKVNELKRTILMKEQKLLELQDLEAQTSSYKSQIEYLKNALEREKRKVGEEKDKNKKLQNELNEAVKNQKTENKSGEDNLVLEELRMRGTISGGIVQEFGDKEKMKKLAKDIGILKELCRSRYAEIKRLEAENATLRSHTPKNSNQMDSPIRSKVYNTRSKNPVRDLWKTELSGKENSAV